MDLKVIICFISLFIILNLSACQKETKTEYTEVDVAKAIAEVKAGKIEYRVDKTGIIHAPIGKASFDLDKLVENFNTLAEIIVKAKPAAQKGQYVKSVTVSSTMGPGVKINPLRIQ